MTQYLFAFSVAVLIPLFSFADTEPGEVCDNQSIMTISWTICLIDTTKTPEQLKSYIDEGMNEARRIDEWMSEWKPNSIISQINVNAGIKPVKVTDEALETIKLSLEHARLSKGSFDITFNAFFGLYNWKKGQEHFPSDADIKRLLPLVNYKNVVVNEKDKTVFLKKKGMKIGLGGMGEGWAVDKIFELLKPKKIQAGYVDSSGAVRVWGRKPGGKLWSIGIGNPRPMDNNPDMKNTIGNLYATDLAVTTAGDSEKFFIKDGKRYHHIIDPKTGRSANQSIQVTAICKTATLCDLADDGIYILGPVEGAKYAKLVGVEAVIIDPEGKTQLTPGVHVSKTVWGPAVELDKNLDLK